MRILAVALLLTSCAAEPAERVFSPTEELWIDTYCHGDLSFSSDAGRVARWAEKNRIKCYE